MKEKLTPEQHSDDPVSDSEVRQAISSIISDLIEARNILGGDLYLLGEIEPILPKYDYTVNIYVDESKTECNGNRVNISIVSCCPEKRVLQTYEVSITFSKKSKEIIDYTDSRGESSYTHSQINISSITIRQSGTSSKRKKNMKSTVLESFLREKLSKYLKDKSAV